MVVAMMMVIIVLENGSRDDGEEEEIKKECGVGSRTDWWGMNRVNAQTQGRYITIFWIWIFFRFHILLNSELSALLQHGYKHVIQYVILSPFKHLQSQNVVDEGGQGSLLQCYFCRGTFWILCMHTCTRNMEKIKVNRKRGLALWRIHVKLFAPALLTCMISKYEHKKRKVTRKCCPVSFLNTYKKQNSHIEFIMHWRSLVIFVGKL